MEVGDNITVSIKDYYVGLQSITQDTNHVRRTIIDIPDPDQPQKPKKYLQLEALEGGQTKFEILDGENTKVVLEVTVRDEDTNDGVIGEGETAKFLAVNYYSRQVEDGADVIEFSTQGDVQEVGIDFERDGQAYYQLLEVDPSGKYILACEDCRGDASHIYLKDSTGQKVYAKSIRTRFTPYGVQSVDGSEIADAISGTPKQVGITYYQMGKSNGVEEGYLNGLSQAVEWYLTKDRKVTNVNNFTNATLELLAKGKSTYITKINGSPFQQTYEDVKHDIDVDKTHYYAPKEMQWLIAYLGTSAVLQSTNTDFDTSRVTRKVDLYHGARKNGIKSVIYTSTVGEEGVAGIKFEVTGSPSSVGVDFKDENGTSFTKTLTLQPDGIYIIGFTNDSCSGCSNFKPYAVLGGQKVYYKDLLTFNYNSGVKSELYVSIDDIAIADASYTYFVQILRSIWYWKGYDQEYNRASEKVVDLREDYGDYASLAVSLFPLVGEGYDVTTLLLGKDPITQEVLDSFDIGITVIGLLSGWGSGKLARDTLDALLAKISDDLGIKIEEVTAIAKEIISEYNINSLDDIVELRDILRDDTSFTKLGKKIKLKIFLKIKWTPTLRKHIIEGDYTISPYKLTGLHYNGGKIKKEIPAGEFLDVNMNYSEYTTGDIVIIGKKDLGNGFYEGDIAIFDEARYAIQAGQPGMSAPRGFTKKADPSTFFPDTRSEEKIKNEIAEAYTNYKPKIKDGETVYGGKMSDGNYIEFTLNDDGSIKSAYPNLQQSFIDLFK